MSQYIVCLTFDFDTVSGWIANGLTTPTPISRGEFGLVGAERILELLEHHGIPSTWFIPGVTLETYPNACRAVADAGHEIAHHGWAHVPPTKLSPTEERESLIRANAAIAELTGRSARGYRSPSWDLSPRTVDLLLEQGFVYDSSMMGHDYLPYRARSGDVVEGGAPVVFGPETELIEMPISWSLDDYPQFEIGRQPGLRPTTGVLQNWLDDFLYLTTNLDWGILTYTCHPYVIGRGHRMLMLERLIQALAERGARFSTMEDAAADFVEVHGSS